MGTRTFDVSFYIEGNEDAGFYAWLSQSSPRAELCRLLSDVSDDELRQRASEELGCTCDACLNIIRKEIEDEKSRPIGPETPTEIDAALHAAGYDPDEIGAQMKAAAEAALARVAERDGLNDGENAKYQNDL